MSDDISISTKEIISRLEKVGNVAVFTHIRPDADAIGSQVAICRLLVGLGKKATLVSLSTPPAPLRFLLDQGGFARVDYTAEWGQAHLTDFDLIVVVDTSAPQQLEPATALLRPLAEKMVILDHHIGGDMPCAVLVRNNDAPACVELVADLFGRMHRMIDTLTATALLAGLVADTGWFRFDSVRPATHRLAADLIAAGASSHQVYSLTAQQESRAKLDLMRLALEHMQWFADQKIAITHILQSDLTHCNAQPWQTEGLVDMAMMVANVEVSICIVQSVGGKFRASLRGKGKVDVNKIGAAFGGGGHARAAGCQLDGPADVAVRRLVDAIVPQLSPHAAAG